MRFNDQDASLSHLTLKMLNIDENFNPLQKHQRYNILLKTSVHIQVYYRRVSHIDY
jgi:hypothetical protein